MRRVSVLLLGLLILILIPLLWYVTVIRKERPLPDSPRIAITTAKPVGFFDGRWEILVFDDFFRVMDPVSTEDATP